MFLSIIGEGNDTVTCILCKATVSNRNGDKARFFKHITLDHEVHYDMDLIYAVSFLSHDQKSMLINLISAQIMESNRETKANKEDKNDYSFMEADKFSNQVHEKTGSKNFAPSEYFEGQKDSDTSTIKVTISSGQIIKDIASELEEELLNEHEEDYVQDVELEIPAPKEVSKNTNEDVVEQSILIGAISSEQLSEDSVAIDEELSDEDDDDQDNHDDNQYNETKEEGDPFAKVKCPKCDQMVPRKALELHKKVKHNIKKSQMCCRFCNRTIHRGNFRRHMRVSHPVEDKAMRESEINEKEKCSECNMMLSKKAMTFHMKEHKDMRSTSNCSICNKIIVRGGMRHHMRTAHVMKDLENDVSSTFSDNLFLKCKHCLKLVRRTAYPKHLIEQHTSVRISRCPLCYHDFSTKKNMFHHLEVIHKDKDLHYLDQDKQPKFSKEDCKVKCDDCEEKFITDVSLSFHITRNHGERNYECERCQRKLTSKHNLNRHLEHCSKKIILS